MTSEQWPPSVRVWSFEGAPSEFRELSKFGGGEECVIFVPAELLDVKGQLRFHAIPFDLIDLEKWDREKAHSMASERSHGGDNWGWFTLHRVSGGVVLITKESTYATGYW